MYVYTIDKELILPIRISLTVLGIKKDYCNNISYSCYLEYNPINVPKMSKAIHTFTDSVFVFSVVRVVSTVTKLTVNTIGIISTFLTYC